MNGSRTDGDGLDIFISYTRADREWADWLAWVFEGRLHKTYYQGRDFGIGRSFRKDIEDALKHSAAVALVLSNDYFDSEYAQAERRCAQEMGKQLIPILIREIEDTTDFGLAADVAYIDVAGMGGDEALTKIRNKVEKMKLPCSMNPDTGRVDASTPTFPAHHHKIPAAPTELMGRDDQLGQILALLKPLDVGASGSGGPVGLIPDEKRRSGRGTAGMAAEFVRRNAAEFEQVLWITAQPEELLLLEFKRVGRDLGLPLALCTPEGVYAELGRLSYDRPSLVVFDSAPAKGFMAKYLPDHPRVASLVVSRDESYKEHAVRLGPLSEDQARKVLESAAPHAPDDSIDALVDLLEGDPASVALASRWLLGEGADGPDTYLELLEEALDEFVELGPAVRSLTLHRLRDGHLEAFGLLVLLSQVASRGFPVATFRRGAGVGEPMFDVVLRDDDRLNDAIGALEGAGVLFEGAGLIAVSKLVASDAATLAGEERQLMARQAMARMVVKAQRTALSERTATAHHLAHHLYHLAHNNPPEEIAAKLRLVSAQYLVAVDEPELARRELDGVTGEMDRGTRTKVTPLLVELCVRGGDLPSADSHIEDALSADLRPAERRVMLTARGHVRAEQGRHDEADAAFDEAMSLAHQPRDRLAVLRERHSAERLAGNLEAAFASADERYHIAVGLDDADALTALDALVDRGSTHLALGHFEQACDDLTSARAALLSKPDEYQRIAALSEELAAALIRSARDDAAMMILGHAAVIRRSFEGPRSPALARIYASIAECHRRMGDLVRAAAMCSRARSMDAGTCQPDLVVIPRPPDDVLKVIDERCVPIIGPNLTDRVIGDRREMAHEWAADYARERYYKEVDDLPHIAQDLLIRNDPDHLRKMLRKYFKKVICGRYADALPVHVDEDDRGVQDELLIPELVNSIGAINRAIDPFEYHGVLARLNSNLYITTAPSDLLLDALRDEGKSPTDVVCDWLHDPPEVRCTWSGRDPDVERPMVVHLFGSLSVPGSVLLAEHDYLEFVIRYAELKHLVPSPVAAALGNGNLLLVGFDLDDWDFSVLLQGFIDRPARHEGSQPGAKDDDRRPRSEPRHAAVQVEDKEDGYWANPDQAKKYLDRLLNKNKQRKTASIIWQDLDSLMIQVGHELGL